MKFQLGSARSINSESIHQTVSVAPPLRARTETVLIGSQCCLLGRHEIKGGETRVFEVDTPNGQRFTLNQPWSLLMLNDRRVIHETTPIQPTSEKGWRDTLVITLKADSFLDEAGAS